MTEVGTTADGPQVQGVCGAIARESGVSVQKDANGVEVPPSADMLPGLAGCVLELNDHNWLKQGGYYVYAEI